MECMKHIFKIILLLAFQTFCVSAQTNLPLDVQTNASSIQSEVKISESSELVAAKQQIKLPEMQLSEVRSFQDSILTTVHWALAGVFVLFGLLLGVGWFANFKIYDRDKDSLKAEVQSSASIVSSDLSSQLIRSTVELEQMLESKFGKEKEAIYKSVQTITNESLKPILSTLNELTEKFDNLELGRLRKEMQDSPSDSTALTRALRLFEFCTYRNQEHQVPETVNFIINKLDAGGKFTATEITRVNALIDKLPEHYKVLTDKVRTKLVASDIF